MNSEINSERKLTAQDRLADRGIGLHLDDKAIETLASKNTIQSTQFIADTLAQIYKESPQMRAALENKMESIDFRETLLPGQVTLGVNPVAIQRILSSQKNMRQGLSSGM